LIGWLIIACEVGFWVLVLAGLLARYVFHKKKLGAFLLICTPIVDLILLFSTVIDLKNGAVATTVHGIAAIYIAISIVYGHSMIKWADEKFAYKYAGGEKPIKQKRYGRDHAKHERQGWYRHVLAWMIGGSIIAAVIFFIDNASQTKALLGTLQTWTLIVLIDFLISFSYSIFPKKVKNDPYNG
jgi:hypothetical protein